MSGEKLTEDKKIILIEVLHRTALQTYYYYVEYLALFVHIKCRHKAKIHFRKQKALSKKKQLILLSQELLNEQKWNENPKIEAE